MWGEGERLIETHGLCSQGREGGRDILLEGVIAEGGWACAMLGMGSLGKSPWWAKMPKLESASHNKHALQKRHTGAACGEPRRRTHPRVEHAREPGRA